MTATMRDAFVTEARSMLAATDALAVVLADISADRFRDAGRHVVNVGIREQAMVGVAAGLSLAGVHPLVHTYAPFLVERAWEQVKLDLSHQGVGATLVTIGASYDASAEGRTHQAPGDVALLDTLRDWRIEVPSHPDDVAPVLRRAVAAGDRTYVRLADDVAAHPGPVDGTLRVLRRGSRGLVLAVGPLVDRVLTATAGLDLTVAHAVTVRPLDLVTLRGEVDRLAAADVVLVEPYLAGTSTAVVAGALADRPHRVLALGVRQPDLHRFGSRADHDRAQRLDVVSLREDIGSGLGLAGFASPPRWARPGNPVGAVGSGEGMTGPPATVPPAGWLRRALRARVGGLPAPFWWLWVGTLVNRAGGFVQPFLVLYLTGPRGLSVGQSGVVLAAYGAGAFVSQPLGGVLTDRVGRRATLVGGLAATGVLLGALGAARGFGPVVVAAAALGVVSDLFRPAATAVVADLLDEAARPRAFAVQFWAINLGFSVAGVLGGVLAAHGYTVLFVVDALTCVVFAVLVGVKVPETRPDRPPGPPAARFEGLRTVVHDRLLLATIGLISLYAVTYLQVYTVLPLHTRDVGLGTTAYGVAIALNGIAIVVLQPVLLPLFDRLPRGALLGGSLLLVGVGVAATGLADTLPVLMATVVVWSVGEIGFSGSIQALVTSLAPPHLRGRYAGATGVAWGGSVLFGPLIGTSVYAHAPAALWWGCLVLGALTAAGYVLLDRTVARRPAPALSDAGATLPP